MAWFEMTALLVNSAVSPWLSLAISEPNHELPEDSMSYVVESTLSEDNSESYENDMSQALETIQANPLSNEEEQEPPDISWDDIINEAGDAYGIEQERKKKEQEEQDKLEREHENKYGW